MCIKASFERKFIKITLWSDQLIGSTRPHFDV